ncbi:uncharacterized protein DEA37_0006267 [Paragonimus westermani]|uniref:Uncharacterized protein n=1 Tax=Paragonimus westermani TaxID=34504 RepID=A0A5J4NVT2_9TREM|nr:uncharacterized protein DEA37_0006267 [Paragonimus westermani]
MTAVWTAMSLQRRDGSSNSLSRSLGSLMSPGNVDDYSTVMLHSNMVASSSASHSRWSVGDHSGEGTDLDTAQSRHVQTPLPKLQKILTDSASSIMFLGKRILREYQSVFVLPDKQQVFVRRNEVFMPEDAVSEVTLSMAVSAPSEVRSFGAEKQVRRKVQEFLENDDWKSAMLASSESRDAELLGYMNSRYSNSTTRRSKLERSESRRRRQEVVKARELYSDDEGGEVQFSSDEELAEKPLADPSLERRIISPPRTISPEPLLPDRVGRSAPILPPRAPHFRAPIIARSDTPGKRNVLESNEQTKKKFEEIRRRWDERIAMEQFHSQEQFEGPGGQSISSTSLYNEGHRGTAITSILPKTDRREKYAESAQTQNARTLPPISPQSDHDLRSGSHYFLNRTNTLPDTDIKSGLPGATRYGRRHMVPSPTYSEPFTEREEKETRFSYSQTRLKVGQEKFGQLGLNPEGPQPGNKSDLGLPSVTTDEDFDAVSPAYSRLHRIDRENDSYTPFPTHHTHPSVPVPPIDHRTAQETADQSTKDDSKQVGRKRHPPPPTSPPYQRSSRTDVENPNEYLPVLHTEDPGAEDDGVSDSDGIPSAQNVQARGARGPHVRDTIKGKGDPGSRRDTPSRNGTIGGHGHPDEYNLLDEAERRRHRVKEHESPSDARAGMMKSGDSRKQPDPVDNSVKGKVDRKPNGRHPSVGNGRVSKDPAVSQSDTHRHPDEYHTLDETGGKRPESRNYPTLADEYGRRTTGRSRKRSDPAAPPASKTKDRKDRPYEDDGVSDSDGIPSAQNVQARGARGPHVRDTIKGKGDPGSRRDTPSRNGTIGGHGHPDEYNLLDEAERRRHRVKEHESPSDARAGMMKSGDSRKQPDPVDNSVKGKVDRKPSGNEEPEYVNLPGRAGTQVHREEETSRKPQELSDRSNEQSSYDPRVGDVEPAFPPGQIITRRRSDGHSELDRQHAKASPRMSKPDPTRIAQPEPTNRGQDEDDEDDDEGDLDDSDDGQLKPPALRSIPQTRKSAESLVRAKHPVLPGVDHHRHPPHLKPPSPRGSLLSPGGMSAPSLPGYFPSGILAKHHRTGSHGPYRPEQFNPQQYAQHERSSRPRSKRDTATSDHQLVAGSKHSLIISTKRRTLSGVTGTNPIKTRSNSMNDMWFGDHPVPSSGAVSPNMPLRLSTIQLQAQAELERRQRSSSRTHSLDRRSGHSGVGTESRLSRAPTEIEGYEGVGYGYDTRGRLIHGGANLHERAASRKRRLQDGHESLSRVWIPQADNMATHHATEASLGAATGLDDRKAHLDDSAVAFALRDFTSPGVREYGPEQDLSGEEVSDLSNAVEHIYARPESLQLRGSSKRIQRSDSALVHPERTWSVKSLQRLNNPAMQTRLRRPRLTPNRWGSVPLPDSAQYDSLMRLSQPSLGSHSHRAHTLRERHPDYMLESSV